MRVGLMVLLLLLPLASGWQTPADPKAIPISTPNGEERLLVLEEGVWTSADWQGLLTKAFNLCGPYLHKGCLSGWLDP